MLRVFTSGLDHPEGIAVGSDGAIYCGGEAGQVYRIDPSGARFEQIASTGGFCLGIAPHPDGRLFICDCGHRALMVVEGDGQARVVADGLQGAPFVNPNFAVFDRFGHLYMSDSGEWGTPGGAIFRIAPDGTVAQFHPGPFHFANGLALDAAERWLYIVESTQHRIVRIPIGTPQPHVEVFARGLERVPDGMAFGADGALYVTCFASDRIYRVSPEGQVQLLIQDEDAFALNRPTNCAFREQELLIANLGGDFISTMEVGVGGMPLWHQRKPVSV